MSNKAHRKDTYIGLHMWHVGFNCFSVKKEGMYHITSTQLQFHYNFSHKTNEVYMILCLFFNSGVSFRGTSLWKGQHTSICNIGKNTLVAMIMHIHIHQIDTVADITPAEEKLFTWS